MKLKEVLEKYELDYYLYSFLGENFINEILREIKDELVIVDEFKNLDDLIILDKSYYINDECETKIIKGNLKGTLYLYSLYLLNSDDDYNNIFGKVVDKYLKK